jgi:hypothetical protein
MGVDSNHRSVPRQIYSLLPLATREPIRIDGAGDGTRTYNLLITNQLLCQLSYTSKKAIGDPEGARTLDLQRDRLAF